MKTYRTTAGPFLEKPYYEPNDIEILCIDELSKVGLFPSNPEPIRIDHFIFKKFKLHPTYEDLPDGILGCTQFGPNGVRGIIISRALSEEGSRVAERRINTTLAHEAGHGLLHTHLFAFGQNPASLFDNDFDSNTQKLLSRSTAVPGSNGSRTPQYIWWEYQANLVMGSLLMPKILVNKALGVFFTTKGQLGLQVLNKENREHAIRALSEIFDVNPIVARIRLDAIFPTTHDLQLTL